MKDVSTIGLDLAKNVFQVHGVDGSGKTVLRRRLRRGQVLPIFRKLSPRLVGIEACATSHYWAREITALGHEVRMMPARYVKPYVKRNENDVADAEAICEAVTRSDATAWFPIVSECEGLAPATGCEPFTFRVRVLYIFRPQRDAPINPLSRETIR